MDESYETFEEEWMPSAAESPPQKPVRQIYRPGEMFTKRKFREETAPVLHQQRSEVKPSPAQTSFSKTTFVQKSFPVQNVTPTETPWENVTLNRCLFVAITILVVTSGFQRLTASLYGHRSVEEGEEEDGLMTRPVGMLQRHSEEPAKSLWEVMFWWLPDLEDEDDDEIKKRRSKKKVPGRTLGRLRNKPLPDKNLLKQGRESIKARRAKKTLKEKIKIINEKAVFEKLRPPDDEEKDEEEIISFQKNLSEEKNERQTFEQDELPMKPHM